MPIHLMTDLETLGKQPNTVVLSVGAVLFTKDQVLKTGQWPLNLDEQLKNRKVDGSTITWWMKQEDAAKTVFDEAMTGTYVKKFLTEFLEFIGNSNVVIWGNGASFDVPILEHLLYSNGYPIPWHYWNIRCYRTVKKVHNIEKGRFRQGTKHRALDDALFQAEALRDFFQVHPEYDV